MQTKPSVAYTVAVIIAAGLVGLGLSVGQGLVQAKLADRFVTVKGVAERDVEADLAFWSITIAVPSVGVESAQREIEGSVSQVVAFLGRHGIDSTSISREASQVIDRDAQYGRQDQGLRFVVSNTLLVRSTDVAAIDAASQAVGELLAQGVPLTNGQGWGYTRPTYSFTQLNGVKPDMIAEATASARDAAQQFANDSGGRVGDIRRANQGVFVIQGRDTAPGSDESVQRFKRVRVVATVEYQLVN